MGSTLQSVQQRRISFQWEWQTVVSNIPIKHEVRSCVSNAYRLWIKISLERAAVKSWNGTWETREMESKCLSHFRSFDQITPRILSETTNSTWGKVMGMKLSDLLNTKYLDFRSLRVRRGSDVVVFLCNNTTGRVPDDWRNNCHITNKLNETSILMPFLERAHDSNKQQSP